MYVWMDAYIETESKYSCSLFAKVTRSTCTVWPHDKKTVHNVDNK